MTWIDAGRPTPVPAEVERWLEGLREPAAAQEIADLWLLTRAPEPPDGGLEDLRVRMRDEPSFMRRGPALYRIAASIALIGLGFSGGWFALRKSVESGPVQQVMVPVAASAKVELAGNIVVELNAESRLTYSTTNGRITEVELEGEGFFRVPHDPKRQFVVRTSAGVVRDLGTDFNVRARDGELAVAVASGLVAVENAGQSVEVRAGESARASTGAPPSPATQADVDAIVGWTSGRLVFVDQSLGAIAAELSRKYGVTISVAPALTSTRITARVVISADVTDALRTVTLPAAARYSQTQSGWEITPLTGK